jgi:sterol desaturase/sphingolipid hydroxylase (fatty acid hydroxylase superfamily)
MEMDSLLRLAGFFGVLGLMVSWEVITPRRPLSASKPTRWVANLGTVLLDTLLVRLLFATGAVGAALVATEHAWGVLNQVNWPTWFEMLLAVIVLDFAIYLQHVLFHTVPIFWRFHMVHHTDLDVDVTTGVRFHPGEVALSMLIKLAVVVLLGAPPSAVLVFEVLLNATSMFNHSNVRMPELVERLLRWIVVTPDMHRIHHSVIPPETNSNFGFNLPWWDRLFGTYQASPHEGHLGMTLGLEQFRNPRRLTLARILWLPFVGSPGRSPLVRPHE